MRYGLTPTLLFQDMSSIAWLTWSIMRSDAPQPPLAAALQHAVPPPQRSLAGSQPLLSSELGSNCRSYLVH